MRLISFLVLGVISLAGLARPAPAQFPAGVVDPNYNHQQDAQGFTWDFYSQYGGFRRGSDYAFNYAGRLMFAESMLNFTAAKMSQDGREYYFAASTPTTGVTVMRRLKVERNASCVRFVDSFRNSSSRDQSISAGFYVGTNSQFQPAISSAGRAIQQTLEKKEIGVALLQASTSRPDVIIYSPSSKQAKVAIIVQSNQAVQLRYLLKVPAGETVSLVYGLAQRRYSGVPSPATLKEQFAVFERPEFMEDLPREVKRSLVNWKSRHSLSEEAASPLVELEQLADAWDVSLDEQHDLLVLDEESQLAGTLVSGRWNLVGEYGKSDLHLSEVAAATVFPGDQQVQVYLWTGEILRAEVSPRNLRFKTNGGLTSQPQLPQLAALFRRVPPALEAPVEEAMLVRTVAGDQLLVKQLGSAGVKLATPWGALSVPLSAIATLERIQEPQPMLRVQLWDGSSFQAMSSDDVLSFVTSRFGDVELPISHLVSLRGLKRPKVKATSERRQVFELLGDNLLVGRLTEAQLKFQTAGGMIQVAAETIQEMSATGELRTFAFTLAGDEDEEVVGRLEAATLQVEFHGTSLRVPVRYLDHCQIEEIEAEEEVKRTEKGDKAESEPADKLPAGKDDPFGSGGGDPFGSGDDPFGG